MIASGSLAPVSRSPIGKSSQGFYSYPFIASIADHKIEHGEARSGSSDSSDLFIRVRQLELINETNQKVKETLVKVSKIIVTLDNLMYELKASGKNSDGDFA
jgi:hypothetical protein